jgi:hypothetical protein
LRFVGDPLHLSRRTYAVRTRPSEDDERGIITAALTLDEGSESRTRLKRLSLDIFGVEITVDFEGPQDESIRVNGYVAKLPPDSRLVWTLGSILPQLRIATTESPAQRVSDADFAAPRRRVRFGEDEVVQAVSHLALGSPRVGCSGKASASFQ